MTAPTEIRRPGKHTIRPGDDVRVAGADLESFGVKIRDRGWSGARVLRFVAAGRAAEVTVPGRAGTRVVAVDRLTRTRQSAR